MAASTENSAREWPVNGPHIITRASLGETGQPWSVIDIDIADGVPDLPGRNSRGEQIGGVFVIVRVFTEPIDGLWIAIVGPGLSRQELGRLVDIEAGDKIRHRLQLAGYEDFAADLPLNGVNVSARPEWLIGRDVVEAGSVGLTVALCTRDRPEEVERCLASLQAQTYPHVTVLVIDNAPTDDRVRKLVEEGEFRVPTHYVLEPIPGLSFARNKAIGQCDTELIAFIDDDEEACPYWASELVRGFTEDPTADCVTGVITPCELETTAQLLFERYGGHSKGRGFQALTFDGQQMGKLRPLFPLPPFGTGANMSFRTSTLRELGNFDTALGAGTASCGGEDTDILSTILLDERRIAYRPSALVRHYHRRTIEQLHSQMYGLGVGLTAFYTAVVARNPIYVFRLFALAPRAFREVFGSSGDRGGTLGISFPKDLLAANRRGMIRGPMAYWMTRIRQRRNQPNQLLI